MEGSFPCECAAQQPRRHPDYAAWTCAACLGWCLPSSVKIDLESSRDFKRQPDWMSSGRHG